ncbi:MAG: aminopeptidase [Defluviitaleaceae bacterium]|nr:aminopeptidase [Defluviitaleaceae bacterium]
MDKLNKYSILALEKGVNIKKSQKLLIRSSVDNADFVRTLTELAWKRGAKDVMVQWFDDKINRKRYLYGDSDIFGIESKWYIEYINKIIEEDYQIITVISSNPENLKDIDPEKITKESKVISKMLKPLGERMMDYTIQWSIIALPCKEWAVKVFPNAKTPEEAVNLMWEAIFKVTLIDDNDPIENWDNHIKNLSVQTKKIQDYNFKSLIFKNSLGTDLEIGLPKGHIWVSGEKKSKKGNSFIANIPTYEVFTAPHRDEVNGIVYSTKPLIYMGNVIDKFWIKFQNGKAVEYKAEVGNEFLEKMITIHPNADFLGEVALVPHSSPISQSGLLWYNTLYDENASCHIALGKAYPSTLAGSENLSEEERMAKGLNQSLSHNDFMIGSACMNIIGKTEDGKEIQVFKDGEWSI